MEQQIIVYKSSDGSELPVKTDGETVWLTQEQMCKLFGRTQPVIARHIANIFKEGELEKEVVYAKFAYTTRQGAIAGKTQVKEVGLDMKRLEKPIFVTRPYLPPIGFY